MNLSLPSHVQKLIDDRVKSGKYGTAEDVVAAAISNLDQQEAFGDFEPGEFDRLIEEGERSGDALDGEQVLAELKALRGSGRTKAG
ncbi:MAG: type II toxin-antitoxin system ParD family antitoxin [Tepidisphaeraceae bacterium]